MPIIGRAREQNELENFYQSKQAEFLAVYGRRRIGKTFLIINYFNNKPGFFLHVTGIKDGSTKEQISRFTRAISDTFYKGSDIKEADNWLDAFDNLTDAINKHTRKNAKVVIFLDEFPWMATHKSKLLQTLEYFWNHTWSHDNRIKLIICGSSASWIINKIINNKAGLHNRVTRKIYLKPFNLFETKQFLTNRSIKLNHWHITQLYMTTGGVPFYLSFAEKGLSSAQMIERLAFSENSPLLKEFDNLLASLFDEAEPYIELLKIISQHRYGCSLSTILEDSNYFSKGGRIGKKLNELKDAGFILSFKPYKNKKKGVYYRVIDEYTLFYFHWIEPIRNTLQESALSKGYWQDIQSSPAWYSWAGYAFEAIVYKHLEQVRQTLNIPASAIANSWRYAPTKNSKEDGAQIDLLFDRRDNVITLCEIKFTSEPFVIDKAYAKKLLTKQAVFTQKTKTKKQLFMAMVTACGLKDNPYSDEIICNIATLADLFNKID